MVTSWLARTSDTAKIAGYHIQTQTQLIQANMSIFPQMYLIFIDLTVEEHLVSVLKVMSFEAS